MANTLLLKKSGSASEVPDANELTHGELALNYADGKVFFKNSSNAVSELISAPGTGAGQVLFSSAGASSINGDSTFFYDDSNNRLGIGTATPQKTLDASSISGSAGTPNTGNGGGGGTNTYYNSGGHGDGGDGGSGIVVIRYSI